MLGAHAMLQVTQHGETCILAIALHQDGHLAGHLVVKVVKLCAGREEQVRRVIY